MVQRGKELGYTMSTERFNSIVENIKKENKIESDEALQAALKQEGMTMADLRRQLERTMLVQQVQQTEIMAEAAGHRHRAQDLLRSAQGRVRHRAADHAARDHDQRAGDRAGHQRGAGRCGEGEGRGGAREDRRRRTVRAARRRLFRFRIEGQRRPRRPALARAISPRICRRRSPA